MNKLTFRIGVITTKDPNTGQFTELVGTSLIEVIDKSKDKNDKNVDGVNNKRIDAHLVVTDPNQEDKDEIEMEAPEGRLDVQDLDSFHKRVMELLAKKRRVKKRRVKKRRANNQEESSAGSE